MSRHTLVILPGDGIGPEVAAGAVRVLQEIGARFGVGSPGTELEFAL